LERKGKYSDVDDLFRNRFSGYEPVPGPGLKARLMKKVAVKEFFSFYPARFNVYYLAVAAAVTGAVLLVTLGGGSGKSLPETMKIPGDSVAAIMQPITDTASMTHSPGVAPVTGKTPAFTTGNRPSDSHKESQPVIFSADEVDRKTVKSDAVSVTVDPIREVANPVRGDTTLQKTAVSSFKMSVSSGCAPLVVELTSTSGNAHSLQWSSGDGRHSDGKSLTWVFNQPGSYTVSLKAIGYDGSEDNASAMIVVHPSPVAKFDVSPANREVSDRDIMLFNYSAGFLTAAWDFGDGGKSHLRDPLHSYKASGKFRITLKVSNEYGCFDTLSKVYSTAPGIYRIDFPNAFIPNNNGPTGGYYSLRSDEAAYVFHPEYEGVTDYHLVVYSRTGVMLFESRDLNIGWDGYYKGQLCEPGVYVYRARGRYANGEQYQKSGDVTILRFR